MKFLLLKDVPRVGQKGQIIDVSESYGMNVFVNKGLAKRATDNIVKEVVKKNENKKIEKEMENDKTLKILNEISKIEIIIKKKVDDKNNFYSKVSVNDVVESIFNSYKYSLSPKQILIPDISKAGDYVCEVVYKEKKFKLNLKIEAVK